MNVEEFINRLNESFSKFDLKGFEFLTDILLPKPKVKINSCSGKFLFDLYDNYILSGRTIGFDFNNKLEIHGEFLFFATQDIFNIGINNETGQIVMWDTEWEKIHHMLSPDLDTFLNIILKIYDYSLPGWFEEKKYEKNDRLVLFEQIENLVSKEYLAHYTEAFNS